MLERVNPFVILKGAELVEPGTKWRVSHKGRVVTGKTAGIWYPDDEHSVRDFNPLASDADAMKLERALKTGGWKFGRTDWPGHERYTAERKYYAGSGEFKEQELRQESDTLLLLKCISAQFSIPLYLEGGE